MKSGKRVGPPDIVPVEVWESLEQVENLDDYQDLGGWENAEEWRRDGLMPFFKKRDEQTNKTDESQNEMKIL